MKKVRDISRDEIRRVFGEKTFSRGLEYFEKGYVERGVKKGNKLVGTVLGSAPNPYKVRVEIHMKYTLNAHARLEKCASMGWR